MGGERALGGVPPSGTGSRAGAPLLPEAWLGTGANVMVVGLAVARFADQGSITVASLIAGGLLIVTGAVAVGYGTFRYRRVAEELRTGTATSAASSVGPSIAAVVLVAATIAAASILLLTA